MTKPRSFGKAPNRTIGQSMGSEHLMDVELRAVITRTEKRIEDHLRYIRENSHDQAVQKVAKIHLAQMLSGLKRLETWRESFR